jgi:tRNA A-37 threonylcarbamoyl transferase component Bud32
MTPEGAPSYAFTKIYKVRPARPYETPRLTADVVRDEFDATARLHVALAGRPGLTSPRPIASLPEQGAIVTQELPGTPLDRVLRASNATRKLPMLEAVAARIGAWLRTYQRSTGTVGEWRADECRTYLDARLRYVARYLGDRPRVDGLALFDRLAADLPASPEPLVAIHADLCPANILITPGGGVGVLDFATAQAGSRFHDLAHLYLHLELARRRAGGRRRIAFGCIQDTLMAGFDRPAAVRDPLFRLMLLQHAVCHVTQLVDTAGWRPRAAMCALARWRWRACLAMSAFAPAAPAA